MSLSIPKKITAAFVSAIAALALACLFSMPQQAMAKELVATGLTAQASELTAQANDNTTQAKALPIDLGSSQTVSGDAADLINDPDEVNYWFRYKTADRNSNYTVEVSSDDGVKCQVRLLNEKKQLYVKPPLT